MTYVKVRVKRHFCNLSMQYVLAVESSIAHRLEFDARADARMWTPIGWLKMPMRLHVMPARPP